MDWVINNNFYIVTKTIVDLDYNIKTFTKVFKFKKAAIAYLTQEKDVLISKLIDKYEPGNYDNFEIEDYGKLTEEKNILMFEDYDGEILVKYELQNTILN